MAVFKLGFVFLLYGGTEENHKTLSGCEPRFEIEFSRTEARFKPTSL